MTEASEHRNAPPEPHEKLGRLFDDLLRDGWLLGMNAGMDPAMARMDPETGVYNRAYFESLTQEAVADMERGRGPRVGDGPERGAVAVLSLRLLDLDGWTARIGAAGVRVIVEETARRLELVLRADDFLGRTRPDTFSLLLRGCPSPMLTQIARRCASSVDGQPYSVDGVDVQPQAIAAAAQWEWGDSMDILAASWKAIGAR